MAGYRVFFKKSVDKDLALIPPQDLRKIFERIETLARVPGKTALWACLQRYYLSFCHELYFQLDVDNRVIAGSGAGLIFVVN